MTSIAVHPVSGKVTVGVDTHKHIHVAVVIDGLGTRLGDRPFSVDSGGYTQLEAWAGSFGPVEAFGIEGTGSYGAGLASFLRRRGHRIVEVNRGDRRARRANGKSDTGGACQVVCVRWWFHVVGSRRPGNVIANALSACFQPWVPVPSSPPRWLPMLRIAR